MTDHDDLETLFARARACPPAAGPDFLARLLEDADRMQPAAPARKMAQTTAVSRRGWLARLAQALGGAGALAGVGSAAMAGLVLGYVQPDALAALADSYSIEAEVAGLDLMPGYDMLYADEVAQ